MKILITGGSGLVGQCLVSHLTQRGHDVVKLTRPAGWDPSRGAIDKQYFQGVKAVIHLAGESIMGRWSERKKQRIQESRTQGTALLSRTLAELPEPPAVFISASAVGIYGDRGAELLTEESTTGSGFLAEVCQAWEQATKPAEEKGIRTLQLRLGVVLSKRGGALKKMLLPFRLGLGGVVGSGEQFMSWVTLTDIAHAVEHVLNFEPIRGPVNLVSPHTATNREFTKALGLALYRPTLIPLPAPIAKLVFGEMAQELLLSSQRAYPAKLMKSGFVFTHTNLSQAVHGLLKAR